ncbi:target of Sbf [Sticta canariensis]|nr:target of Sbf [Sticta canariensis]
MRGTVAAAGIIIFVSTIAGNAAAQACAAGTAQEIHGNWYCSPVKAITYSNFPGTGFYRRVTHMNASSGECSQQRYAYSGSLSPLNEELSLHIRGPTWVKQLAVYVPTVSHPKRSDKAGFHGRRHGHQHLHRPDRALRDLRAREPAEGGVGDVVSVTMNGHLVSWINAYGGPVAASNLATPVTPLPEMEHGTPLASVSAIGTAVQVPLFSSISSIGAQTPISRSSRVSSIGAETQILRPSHNSSIGTETQSARPSPTSSTVAANGSNHEGGSWSRLAYYNAAGGVSEGFTFLNHFGGSSGIPGTADGGEAFGASLSYASSDGTCGAASAQTLSDAMLQDNVELTVLSDRSCDDGGCGYTRPGGVAYHGFGGDHKIFLMEFSMPFTGQRDFNGDMPAIWLHNAQIPLTSQYGTNPDCSCWTSGCGEFDVFEILDPGNFRCKSTLHMAPAGGSSDYFERPSTGTIKAAVVFTGRDEVAHIQVLDDGQGFDETFEAGVVEGFTSRKGNGDDSSLFVLSP